MRAPRTMTDADRAPGIPTMTAFPASPFPTRSPAPAEPEALAREIVERLTYRVGKDPKVAKPHDWLQAAILVTRDRAIEHWMEVDARHLPRAATSASTTSASSS